MRSVPLSLALGLSNGFKFGDQPSHLLWHFLVPTFEFVPQGATERHNRGSPNHNLFFVFFVIHTELTAQIQPRSVSLQKVRGSVNTVQSAILGAALCACVDEDADRKAEWNHGSCSR